ncbi:MAG: cation transporter dimerization domain-containing protein, partial [Thermodesulfobacteriota bacterium]|nr:cation transporter dimerization domain-containing protein [Thermodesulfobacteriota bacterium]
VRLRRSGPILQGEMVIGVPGDMTISEIYKLKSEIQKMVQQKIPDIERLTITSIPYESDTTQEPD